MTQQQPTKPQNEYPPAITGAGVVGNDRVNNILKMNKEAQEILDKISRFMGNEDIEVLIFQFINSDFAVNRLSINYLNNIITIFEAMKDRNLFLKGFFELISEDYIKEFKSILLINLTVFQFEKKPFIDIDVKKLPKKFHFIQPITQQLAELELKNGGELPSLKEFIHSIYFVSQTDIPIVPLVNASLENIHFQWLDKNNMAINIYFNGYNCHLQYRDINEKYDDVNVLIEAFKKHDINSKIVKAGERGAMTIKEYLEKYPSFVFYINDDGLIDVY